MSTTLRDKRDELVGRAAAVGAELAAHAERHDRDGSFVEEGVQLLRDAGLLTIAVPEELGGAGATVSDVAAVQRELARHCGSTALATSMHQHVTTFTAWRFRKGLPGAEATLKRVVEDGIILVSTGGADFTHPRGEATKVDGGFLVSGHKVFASLSPVGNVLSTMFRYDDPEQGPRVLNVPVPMGEGVQVLDTWDAMGMRGTGSHEIVIDGVFVPEEKVLANRPHGTIDPPLQVILSIALPIITAVYLGVAEGAYEAAVASAASKAGDPTVQRQVGLMSNRLRVASWALDGALAMVGDDPVPSLDTLDAVMAAKREVAEAGIEVCDLAMEVAGGGAFFKGSVIERAYRDVRGLKLHPLSPEQTLVHAGRVALGQPADAI
ncbi:MAG: acyl-CoA/acyl-ACP dehydrogenase [Actinomycetota bacterium]|jgi:alkylation response protein AidB-like acyl-CoA dehydrogenase|nr:acyl-CoA/acyl-ACP dehydrogenase [Actinomycetota bacterium]